MKKLLLFLIALIVPSAAHASLDIKTAWDKNCSKPGSMAIKATNNYDYAIDLRLCLKRVTGKWTCFVSPDVKPGQTAPASWGYYVCNASGDYFWSTRRAGAWSVKFDDPPGYEASNTTTTPKRSTQTPKAPSGGTGPQIKTAWDKIAKGTMTVSAVNRYTYAVDMRLCLKSKNQRWTCWVEKNVTPNREAGRSGSYYVYGATGDYFWSTRRAGATSVKFDDPQGFQRGF